MASVRSIFTSCLHPSSFHSSSPPVKLIWKFCTLGRRSANGIICALTSGNFDQHQREMKYHHKDVDVKKNKGYCWHLHSAHGRAYCLWVWINTRKVLIKLKGLWVRVSTSSGAILCMLLKIVKTTWRTDWRNSGSFITWSTKLERYIRSLKYLTSE